MRYYDLEVVTQCVSELLEHGLLISVFDGEETAISKSDDKNEIIAALGSTDRDDLFIYKKDSSQTQDCLGFVKFIYGNEPGLVINDYSTNLEPMLTKTNVLVDKIVG